MKTFLELLPEHWTSQPPPIAGETVHTCPTPFPLMMPPNML